MPLFCFLNLQKKKVKLILHGFCTIWKTSSKLKSKILLYSATAYRKPFFPLFTDAENTKLTIYFLLFEVHPNSKGRTLKFNFGTSFGIHLRMHLTWPPSKNFSGYAYYALKKSLCSLFLTSNWYSRVVPVKLQQ